MNDYAMTNVIIIAFACMGAVTVAGGLIRGESPRKVSCTVEIVAPNKERVTLIGAGEIYE